MNKTCFDFRKKISVNSIDLITNEITRNKKIHIRNYDPIITNINIKNIKMTYVLNLCFLFIFKINKAFSLFELDKNENTYL